MVFSIRRVANGFLQSQERADGVQPGCRAVLGTEKEKETLAVIENCSTSSAGAWSGCRWRLILESHHQQDREKCPLRTHLGVQHCSLLRGVHSPEGLLALEQIAMPQFPSQPPLWRFAGSCSLAFG